MNQTAADKEMRVALNHKYKDRVNELCHGDLNVIDGQIIITKWGGSNNRIIFPDESQLSMFLDGVEGQQLSQQYQNFHKDLSMIITDCNDMIKDIKDCPEYFSDDWDYSIIEMLEAIKKVLSKYVK